MKKLFILFLVLIPIIAIGGEIVTTPSNIVLSQPTTNQVDKLRITFFYSPDGNHSAVIWYNIMSNDGSTIYEKKSFAIRNLPDNAETNAADCVAAGDPYGCCTGAGTGDCDESTTDFDDYVSGFGATLKTRSDNKIWEDIQNHFTVE
jgi:hypothetical protein